MTRPQREGPPEKELRKATLQRTPLRLQEVRPEVTDVTSRTQGHPTGELGRDWVFLRPTEAPAEAPNPGRGLHG